MEEKDRRFIRLMGVLSTVGITMVVATVIGYFVGVYLDRTFGTAPWLMITFLLLGIAAGFKNLYDQTKKIINIEEGSHSPAAQSARAVVQGVTKKTTLLAIAGAVAAAGLQSVLWPSVPFWTVPAGVLFGSFLGAVNFRWLALAVERIYLRQGSTGALSSIAAVVINVLKLSAIFIVLFVVIKKNLMNIFGLVGGLSLCFLAIIWQGFGAMTDGGAAGTKRE
jgi:ATP synthase protein I